MCRSTTATDCSTAKGADDHIALGTSRIHSENEKCSGDVNGSTESKQTLESGTFVSCLSLFFLVTGASLTFPHMQSRRDTLGCDSLCYGSMTSVRGALGLIGTALMGRLSDKNKSLLATTLGRIGGRSVSSGRRACLYIGTLASLVGLAIAATVDSLMGLWLSMIPGALLQHNFDVFKALISEYHNDIDTIQLNKDGAEGESAAQSTSRSGSVGKLGMSAGISFMIGPMVAAVLKPSFQSAAYLAIVCTIASGIVIYQLPLPMSTIASDSQQSIPSTCENEVSIENKNSSKSEFTLLNMVKFQSPKSKAAATLLIIRLNMALAFHIFNTIWPSSLKTRFQFGPSEHAKLMSFVGVTYAFSQGFLAKRVIAFCGTNGKVNVIMGCCGILGLGRYIAYYTQSQIVMYISFLFIINALGVLNTVITADTGSIAPSNELGGLFGILEAAQNAAGMIGPFMGGLVEHYFANLYDVSASLVAVVGIYVFLFFFVFWGYDGLVLSCVRGSHNQAKSEAGAKKSM